MQQTPREHHCTRRNVSVIGPALVQTTFHRWHYQSFSSGTLPSYPEASRRVLRRLAFRNGTSYRSFQPVGKASNLDVWPHVNLTINRVDLIKTSAILLDSYTFITSENKFTARIYFNWLPKKLISFFRSNEILADALFMGSIYELLLNMWILSDWRKTGHLNISVRRNVILNWDEAQYVKWINENFFAVYVERKICSSWFTSWNHHARLV